MLLIVINLRGFYGTFEETVRHAFFQVASIVTTTGFATTDFDLWPRLFKVNSIMSDGSGCLCRKYRWRL